MSTCFRNGNRYKRHRYKTKKRAGVVTVSTNECVHCGRPQPVRKTK